MKKSASRSRPGGRGKVKARKFYGFPDVPEGYDPATRTVQSTYEPEGVVVEGFKVVLHAVVEPPVKLVPQPVLQLINEKYKGRGYCLDFHSFYSILLLLFINFFI